MLESTHTPQITFEASLGKCAGSNQAVGVASASTSVGETRVLNQVLMGLPLTARCLAWNRVSLAGAGVAMFLPRSLERDSAASECLLRL